MCVCVSNYVCVPHCVCNCVFASNCVCSTHVPNKAPPSPHCAAVPQPNCQQYRPTRYTQHCQAATNLPQHVLYRAVAACDEAPSHSCVLRQLFLSQISPFHTSVANHAKTDIHCNRHRTSVMLRNTSQWGASDAATRGRQNLYKTKSCE